MQRFYSPQLEGLRFVAALAVFPHRCPPILLLSKLQSIGWTGVDRFLCISAFLITKLILIEHQTTGSFSLGSCYIRRALRIWPLYFGFVSANFAFAVRKPSDAASVVWVLPLRADAFIMGALAAILAVGPRWWMAPLGLAWVACVAFLPPVDDPIFTIVGYPIVDLGCVLIVIGAQGSGWSHGPLASPVMQYSGKSSFGIYVFHLATTGLVLGQVHRMELPEWIIAPIALALTVAVSAASYKFYKRPFLLFKQRF